MTLEEQFEKETGAKLEDLDSWKELCEYYAEYSEWLEEKLTWKKFSNQKPDIGSKVLTRTSLFGDIEYFAVIERWHIFSYTSTKDSEWMYAPE